MSLADLARPLYHQGMPEHKPRSFRAGFVASLPFWPGIAPFGIAYAVSALAAGLNQAQALAMSLLVFAGASQFAATGLFAGGVGLSAIVLATLVINARHLLLAASLAPYLRYTPLPLRALIAAQLTDESYALAMQRYTSGAGSLAYQFGANIGVYLVWQLSTITGLLLGAFIPDPASLGLELIFPLAFMGMLVPLLRDEVRTRGLAPLAAAAVAALLAVGGALFLPGYWYLLLAGVVASAVGALLEGRR